MTQGQILFDTYNNKYWKNISSTATPNWVKWYSETINFSAGDPDANDDNTDGYTVGALWINTVAGSLWYCTGVGTAAATWFEISGGGAGDFLADGTVSMTGNLTINKTDPAVQLKTGGAIQGRMYTTGGDTVVLADIASGDLYLSTLAAGGGDIYIEPDSGELYTTATAITLDHNNTGVENETMIKFDRGTTDTNDAAFVWHVGDNLFKCYSDVDAGTRILGNLKVGYILAQGGISLDGTAIASSKVKIEENDTTGDMEFTVQTGDSFVFKTVA